MIQRTPGRMWYYTVLGCFLLFLSADSLASESVPQVYSVQFDSQISKVPLSRQAMFRVESSMDAAFMHQLEDAARRLVIAGCTIPVQFTFPDGVIASAEIHAAHFLAPRRWYAWGRSQGDNIFSLSVVGDVTSITLFDGNVVYSVRRFDRSTPAHRADRVVVSKLLAENHSVCIPPAISEFSENTCCRGISKIQPEPMEEPRGKALVRRLYVFTSAIRSAAGDADGDSTPGTDSDVEVVMMDITGRLNSVMLNSGVKTVEIEYAGSWESTLSDDIIPALAVINSNNDGVLDEIHVLREIFQADIAVYLQQGDTHAPSGSAYQMIQNPSFWTAIQTGVAAVLPTFIGSHELGHNFGAGHGRSTSNLYPADPLVPYAYGYGTPNGFATVMISGAQPFVRYSNPFALDPVDGLYPLGIDHGVDPANSADVARAIEYAGQTYLQYYRTGTPQTQDCDANGQFDLLDLYYGTATDCDGDGVLDSCQIAADPSLDCNGDGILDSCQLDWSVAREQTQGRVPVSVPPYSPVFNFEDLSDIHSALMIEFEIKANYSDPNVVIEAFVNGQSYGVIFGGVAPTWQNNCPSGPMNYAQLVIPYGTLPTPSVPGTVEVVLTSTSGLQSCGQRQTAVAIEYLTISPADLNRDGVPDCLDNACNLADAAAPFGVLNYFDVAMFLNWYSSFDDRADLAVPLGVWDSADLDAFLAAYNTGCP